MTKRTSVADVATVEPSNEANGRSSHSWLPSLPTLEIVICFLVWIGHSTYAWLAVYQVSYNLKNELWVGFFEPGWSALGSIPKDTSNYEWSIWTRQAKWLTPWYLGHLVFFNICEHVFKKNWKLMMLMYWVIATHHIFYSGILVVSIGFALALYLVALLRVRLLVWTAAVGMLVSLGWAQQWFPFYDEDSELESERIYEYEVFLAYKLLQYLSFFMYLIEHDFNLPAESKGQMTKPSRGFWKNRHIENIFELLFYSFYLPYTITMIVQYKDFRSQLRLRHQVSRNWSGIFNVAFKVISIAMFNDLILHYFYFNALMTSPNLLTSLSLPTLCSVGYISGQYFHLKYMVIFGYPITIAMIDRMSPPGFPICISRVALYSKMWRYFDRGLYGFMRDMIYTPLGMCLGFGSIGRILASFMCFAFVFVWHGAGWAFFVWVTMNFVEVQLESCVVQVYRWESVSTVVNRTFSPLSIRRMLGFLHIICVGLGIFAIFYFLGGVETGNVFIGRVILGLLLSPNLGLIWLIVLGYCYCQCCMEFDRLGV